MENSQPPRLNLQSQTSRRISRSNLKVEPQGQPQSRTSKSKFSMLISKVVPLIDRRLSWTHITRAWFFLFTMANSGISGGSKSVLQAGLNSTQKVVNNLTTPSGTPRSIQGRGGHPPPSGSPTQSNGEKETNSSQGQPRRDRYEPRYQCQYRRRRDVHDLSTRRSSNRRRRFETNHDDLITEATGKR